MIGAALVLLAVVHAALYRHAALERRRAQAALAEALASLTEAVQQSRFVNISLPERQVSRLTHAALARTPVEFNRFEDEGLPPGRLS